MASLNVHKVPWGSGSLDLELPEDWKVTRLEPRPMPPCADVKAEVERALNEPIGAPPLKDLARGKKNVVVIIDDISRPTPIHLLAPHVVAALDQAGVARASVTVIPALGVHREMSGLEVAGRFGGLPEGVRWQTHEFANPAAVRTLGTTSRGVTAAFNRLVCDADLIVCLSNIEPHIIAGFGGGLKNIMPGVAGVETIAQNHALNCRPETFNMVGVDPQHNPMRLDLEEAAAMVGRPTFIVNTVLNGDLEVVRVVGGDPIKAHRQGVATARAIFGVEVPGPADVVVTDSSPMDVDMRQGVKSLANTVRALRPGGVMLVLARCDEGLGEFHIPNLRLPGRAAMRVISRLALPFIGRVRLSGTKAEDKFMLYFSLQLFKQYSVVFYAPTIPREVGARAPFLGIKDTLDAAVDEAARLARKDPVVYLFPKGGVTYPVLPG